MYEKATGRRQWRSWSNSNCSLRQRVTQPIKLINLVYDCQRHCHGTGTGIRHWSCVHEVVIGLVENIDQVLGLGLIAIRQACEIRQNLPYAGSDILGCRTAILGGSAHDSIMSNLAHARLSP